jgi:hypothetical protein
MISVEDNLDAAESSLRELQRMNPRFAIVAPWILEIRLGASRDHVTEDRTAAMRRCCAIAKVCWGGIILGGSRISPGMLEEMDANSTGVIYRVFPGGPSIIWGLTAWHVSVLGSHRNVAAPSAANAVAIADEINAAGLCTGVGVSMASASSASSHPSTEARTAKSIARPAVKA